MKLKHLFTILILLCLVTPLAQAGSLGDRLQQALGNDQNSNDEILPPEEAFYFTYQLQDRQLRLTWDIEYGYYLYQHRFQFEPLTEGLQFGDFILPDGEEKDDPAFGVVTVNKDKVEIDLPLIVPASTDDLIRLRVHYQGCKEGSVCYPPQEQLLEIALGDSGALDTESRRSGKEKISEQDAIQKRLASGNALTNIGLFFVFGLLLSLTPCVFPMVPILSGIVVGQGEDITPTRAFLLSLVYVLAMALTYAVLGVVAAAFGINLQAASQNVWVMLCFSGIFVLLALSMFGFYELQIPSAWQSRLNRWSEQQGQGSLLGTAIMGLLSAVIVGPCVAPPLAGALLYISQTGDAWLGGLALFAMGLGFGVPLLIIGTSAGKLLPKAGAWMESIKQVFGVIMLGVAIWFLQRVLPGMVTLLLWAALLIISAIYLGAFDTAHEAWQRFRKGLAIVILAYGVMLVAGAAVGGSDPLKPFTGSALLAVNQNPEQTQALPFKRFKTVDDLEQILQQAAARHQPVMVDFYADWCIACIEMEHKTFTVPEVQQSLQGVLLLQADVTANDAADKTLLDHFDLFGPPAILFFGADGDERPGYRLVGFVKAEPFIDHVREATSL